jgi:hexosaminidase
MIMSWKGEEAGIIAAQKRLQVIMVPSNYLYFNFSQDFSAIRSSANTLERVYSYNPDPAILSPADCRNIYGVQAALWTEHVFDEITAEKMTFPRLCALSEVAWTMPENRNYSNFFKRLNKHYDFLDKARVSYYVLKPSGVGKELVFTDQMPVNLTNEFGKGKIYYTTDGSEPTIQSQVYSKSLEFDQSATLKAKVIVNKIAESNTLICNIIKKNMAASQQVTDLIPGLNLKYFEGIIDSLVRWKKMSYVKSASISDFSIPDFARADSFGIIIEGYIRIPEDGIYTFSTASDDGSWLFLNDALLVNNDGCHGPSEIENQIALKKGYHRIKVQYFEALYGNALSVYIQGTNLPHQIIPASMLFRSK